MHDVYSHMQRAADRARRLTLLRPIAARDFRLLWLGESVSLFGDQFTYVALVWLTLQLAGSGLVIGTVLMAASIPRAVFMLVGGAMSDRFPPRRLMLVSNAVRAVVVAAITGLVLLDAAQLWHLYLLAVIFGVVGAFFYPAFMAILPMLVENDQLEASNALLRAKGQLSVLIGPAAAGFLVAAAGTSAAFSIDVATFVFAAVTLWLMKGGNWQPQIPHEDRIMTGRSTEGEGLGSVIHQGLAYAWSEPAIRAVLVLIAVVNFLSVGPMSVGLAALAERRFVGGLRRSGQCFRHGEVALCWAF